MKLATFRLVSQCLNQMRRRSTNRCVSGHTLRRRTAKKHYMHVNTVVVSNLHLLYTSIFVFIFSLRHLIKHLFYRYTQYIPYTRRHTIPAHHLNSYNRPHAAYYHQPKTLIFIEAFNLYLQNYIKNLFNFI
jgi:hypothetical protein